MHGEDFIHRNLSRDIIGAAMKVHNTLRPGLREKTYENALVLELTKRGHAVDQQKRFDVTYDGILVDTFVPDLLVDQSVIVDAKCVTAFNETHISIMLGYLAITRLKLALLLNFKEARLGFKRIVA